MKNDEVEILLVEDNPDDAELAYLAFEKNYNIAKSKIHLAKDGAEALKYLFGFADTDVNEHNPLKHHPKLIFLDIYLPMIHGLDILRKIKEHPEAKEIPVVVLTSSKDQMDWIDSHSLGIECYLRKTMNFKELVEATGWALIDAVNRDKTYNFQK